MITIYYGTDTTIIRIKSHLFIYIPSDQLSESVLSGRIHIGGSLQMGLRGEKEVIGEGHRLSCQWYHAQR